VGQWQVSDCGCAGCKRPTLAYETQSDVVGNFFEKALLSNDTPTDDTFRVDLQAERRSKYSAKGKSLLILEYLNPDIFIGDEKGFYEDTSLGRLQMEEEAKARVGNDVFGVLTLAQPVIARQGGTLPTTTRRVYHE
jgi:hypothetical protein